MALDPKTKETVREEALRLSKEFAELDGRRPRVLLIEMENDPESDREERKLAANALADSGWDVDVSPSQQPEDAAKGAADNDVHFVFYTTTGDARGKNAVALSRALALYGRDDILIAVHQVPPEEKESLFRYGILCAFPKDYDYLQASLTMLRNPHRKRKSGNGRGRCLLRRDRKLPQKNRDQPRGRILLYHEWDHSLHPCRRCYFISAIKPWLFCADTKLNTKSNV